MATGSGIGNTIIDGFTQGDLQKKLQAFINDPTNSEVPVSTFFKCFPNNAYTNDEIESIRTSLHNILQISRFYESKRIFNQVIIYLGQLDVMTCMGTDSTNLFKGFYTSTRNFIEQWEKVKNTIPLEMNVVQSVNYLNV